MVITWEQRKLGEIFTEYSIKNQEEYPALTIIQGVGTVLREHSARNLIYNKDSLSNYKFVRKDDFIVHLRSFEGGLEIANSDGLVSPAYHILHGENIDTMFYYLYFHSHEFIDIRLKKCVYGIRDGRSINIHEMLQLLIPYTTGTEQKNIGDFFNSLNNLITLHQRKLNTLKRIVVTID